jgi:nitrite reductase/ring-hydroxylating ferredoxin subunit
MAFHVVATTDEIPPGGRKVATVKGRPIVVFHTNGRYFALYDRCPHQGAKLSEGKLTGLVEASEPGTLCYTRRGEILRCPWHGWEFDLATGKSWCDPRRVRVKNYPVSVEKGERLGEGPHTAETLEVRIDGDYVVVEA